MIERIVYSWSPEVKTLMGVSIVFGVIIGVIAVIAIIMLMGKSPEEEETAQQKNTSRRLLSPRRHRKESESRAVLQATMMVASGAFQAPTRR